MTSGHKVLGLVTGIAVLVWIIAAAVAHHYRNQFFGDSSDLATAADAAALSNAAFVITGCCIVGLCVISAVQEMLKPKAESVATPGGLLDTPLNAEERPTSE